MHQQGEDWVDRVLTLHSEEDATLLRQTFGCVYGAAVCRPWSYKTHRGISEHLYKFVVVECVTCRGQLENEAQQAYCDFFVIKQQKPMALQIWTSITDSVVLQQPFADAREVGSSRWVSHWGSFFKINDPTVVKRLMRAPLAPNPHSQCQCLREAVNRWIKNGACARLFGHSGDAEGIQSILSLQIKPDFLNLILRCSLADVCASDAKSRRQFLGLTAKVAPKRSLPSCLEDSLAPQVHFAGKYFEKCEALISGNVVDDPDDLTAVSTLVVLSWLQSMIRHARRGIQHLLNMSASQNPKVGYSVRTLFVAIRLAGLLRSDSELKSALRLAGDVFGFGRHWLSSSCHMPSKSTLSRERFVLDAGYCLFWRRKIRRWAEAGIDFWIYLVTDGSPHGGKRIHVHRDFRGL